MLLFYKTTSNIKTSINKENNKHSIINKHKISKFTENNFHNIKTEKLNFSFFNISIDYFNYLY